MLSKIALANSSSLTGTHRMKSFSIHAALTDKLATDKLVTKCLKAAGRFVNRTSIIVFGTMPNTKMAY